MLLRIFTNPLLIGTIALSLAMLMISCAGESGIVNHIQLSDQASNLNSNNNHAENDSYSNRQAAIVDIADVITSIDNTQTPKGIKESVFTEFLKVLEQNLIEASFNTGGKFISSPPEGDAGRVLNLAFNDVTSTLSWTYANRADYDLNGEVGIPDITPIASNYLLPVGSDPLLNWIDGSWDGEIGIPDITPIAENYLNNVAAYSIVTCSTVDGEYVEIGQVSFDSRINAIPPRFETALPDGALKYVRVRPLDIEDQAGVLSNFVQPNIPKIESVSPLSGNEGQDVTFDAVVSGGGTFSYTWNFGGGADPNTSNEASPTVKMLDGGSYSANVIAESEFGITQFDFTLTVIPKTYSVTGNITFEGNPLPDISVEMTGHDPQITDSDGNFTFTEVLNGDYTITPVDNAYEFDPPSRDIAVFKADYTGVDFTASPGLFTVSGTVINDEDLPMSNVAVQLTNGTDTFDTTTQPDGTFMFINIPNGTYTLTPSDTYMIFTPSSLEVIGDGVPVENQDFLAEMTHPQGSYPFKTGTGSNWVVRFIKNSTVDVYVEDGTGVNGYLTEFYQSAKDGMIQWNGVADRWGLFHLAYTDNPADAEISVSWVQTLGGNTAGVAQWSVKDDKLEIPITIKIATFVGMNQQTAQSVHDVAAHEAGHALGIWDHSDLEQDLMFPISYTGTPSKRDEYTMYVVYHNPATYSNDKGKRGRSDKDITWTVE